MRITALLGSPRAKSQSSFFARHFLDSARALGKNEVEIQEFTLNKLSYKGCQGCYACKTKLDHCILRDDLTPVLTAVKDSDLIVMASPVYYAHVTAQLKGFTDRTFSYLTPEYYSGDTPSRLTPGKSLLVFLTQGNSDPTLFAPKIYEDLVFSFSFHKLKESHLVSVRGLAEKSDPAKRKDTLTQIDGLAAKIFI